VCIKKGKKQRTLSVKEDKLSLFLRHGATPGKCPRHDDDDDDDDDDGRKNDDDDGRKNDDDDGRKNDDDDGRKRSSRKH
jgi:hypothetical protein